MFEEIAPPKASWLLDESVQPLEAPIAQQRRGTTLVIRHDIEAASDAHAQGHLHMRGPTVLKQLLARGAHRHEQQLWRRLSDAFRNERIVVVKAMVSPYNAQTRQCVLQLVRCGKSHTRPRAEQVDAPVFVTRQACQPQEQRDARDPRRRNQPETSGRDEHSHAVRADSIGGDHRAAQRAVSLKALELCRAHADMTVWLTTLHTVARPVQELVLGVRVDGAAENLQWWGDVAHVRGGYRHRMALARTLLHRLTAIWRAHRPGPPPDAWLFVGANTDAALTELCTAAGLPGRPWASERTDELPTAASLGYGEHWAIEPVHLVLEAREPGVDAERVTRQWQGQQRDGIALLPDPLHGLRLPWLRTHFPRARIVLYDRALPPHATAEQVEHHQQWSRIARRDAEEHDAYITTSLPEALSAIRRAWPR